MTKTNTNTTQTPDPVTGAQALRLIQQHATGPAWLGPVSWSLLRAMGADLSRPLIEPEWSGLSLLQGQPQPSRSVATGNLATELSRLPSRTQLIAESGNELWLNAQSSQASCAVWVAPHAEAPGLEHPEISSMEESLLRILQLTHPGGLVVTWTPAEWNPGKSGALLAAWGQPRLHVTIEDETSLGLWVWEARGEQEARVLLASSAASTGLLSCDIDSYHSRISGMTTTVAATTISAMSALALPGNETLSRKALQGIGPRTRSRILSEATHIPSWSLRKVGGKLECFIGRWHRLSQHELRELQAIHELSSILGRAEHGGAALQQAASNAWNEHNVIWGNPQRQNGPLLRTRPESCISALRAKQELGQLVWGDEQDLRTPLEVLEDLANGQAITREMAPLAGLDIQAMELMLLQEGFCLTRQGWIRPEIYRSAYVTDLIDQLPEADGPEQLQAVVQQRAMLDEILERARAERSELTPFEPYVSIEAAQAYANRLLVEQFPTLNFRGDEIELTRHHGSYTLEFNGRNTEKRRAARMFIERYITRRNRMVNEEKNYARFDRGFRHFCEDHGFIDAIDAERLKGTWGAPQWPERPVSRSLPGWKRTRKARPWQERSAWRTRVQRRGIIAFGTGVGKTMAGLMHALDMSGHGLRAMIVVPASVLPQWRQEADACTNTRIGIIGSSRQANGSWKDVQTANELDQQLSEALKDDCRIMIISAPAFERLRPTREALERLLPIMAGELPPVQSFGQLAQEALSTNSHMTAPAVLKMLAMNHFQKPSHMSQGSWNLACELRTAQMIESGHLTPGGNTITSQTVQTEIEYQESQAAWQRNLDEAGRIRHADDINNTQARLIYLRYLMKGIKLSVERSGGLRTSWDQLNIGCLVVDECHNYKGHNVPSGGGVRYLGTTAMSQRATDMLIKVRLVQQIENSSTIGLSATPYKNSVVDIYNLLDMFAPEVWERLQIKTPRQFINRYCMIKTIFETPRRARFSGTAEMKVTREPVQVLERFKNVRELRQITSPYIDLVKAADIDLKIPESRPQYHTYRAVPEAVEVIREVGVHPDLALARYGGQSDIMQIPDKEARINEAMQRFQGLMRISQRAELDLEMIDPWKHKGDVSPKVAGLLNQVARHVASGIKVLIFCDTVNMFNPHDPEHPNPNGYDFHEKLAGLIARRTGIDRSQVGIINGTATPRPEDRHAVAQALNDGRMSVVIGNSDVMGESLNLQDEVGAIEHLDLPPNPAGIEQRQGRVIRQGNELERVHEGYHLGSRGQDTVMMDLMRGKRGLYDQLWQGTEDIVDNPERAQIPTLEALALLAIDDDELRARRAAQILEREHIKAITERARTQLPQVIAIQEYTRLRNEIEEEELTTGKKTAGARSLRLKRLERTAAIASDQLRIEGFAQTDLLDDPRLDEMIFLPHMQRIVRPGELMLVPSKVVENAQLEGRFRMEDLKTDEEIEEETTDAISLLKDLEEQDPVIAEAREMRRANSSWSVCRLKSTHTASSSTSVEIMTGKRRGQVVRCWNYDLQWNSPVPPSNSGKLLLSAEAGESLPNWALPQGEEMEKAIWQAVAYSEEEELTLHLDDEQVVLLSEQDRQHETPPLLKGACTPLQFSVAQRLSPRASALQGLFPQLVNTQD